MISLSQIWTVASYIIRQKAKGKKRYPVALMLEPLMRCNLSCAGCGKIQYPKQILKSHLSVEECLQAAKDCGAPVTCVAGGEPLMHPDIVDIVEGLVAQKRFVYLCTNGILLEEKLDLFTPSKYLAFSLHLDGLPEEHDRSVCRDGVFEKAKNAVKAARARGFRVTTNTTLFNDADPGRVRDFFDEAMEMDVEAMMISPGYAYEKAPEQNRFPARDVTRNLFRHILKDAKKSWRFNQSPLYLEFLAGKYDFECSPWGNPAYNVFGWQQPCYLLEEGYAASYEELMEKTDWENYGHKSGNPKCRDCMMHSGYESTAVDYTFSSWKGFFETAKAAIRGPRPDPPEDFPVVNSESGDEDKDEEKSAYQKGDVVRRKSDFPEQFAAAIDGAFKYRGNVTLGFRDGSEATGYLCNRNGDWLELWPDDGPREKRKIGELESLVFSGEDTAEGKSYRAWLKRKAKQDSKRSCCEGGTCSSGVQQLAGAYTTKKAK